MKLSVYVTRVPVQNFLVPKCAGITRKKKVRREGKTNAKY